VAIGSRRRPRVFVTLVLQIRCAEAEAISVLDSCLKTSLAHHWLHGMPAPRACVLDNSHSAAPLRVNSKRTDDELGPQACLDYVRALPGVRFRTGKIVATGVSAGGLMSIPMASRYTVFTHAMLLHSRCSPWYTL